MCCCMTWFEETFGDGCSSFRQYCSELFRGFLAYKVAEVGPYVPTDWPHTSSPDPVA